MEAIQPAIAGVVILDICRNWPTSRREEARLDEQFDEDIEKQREWRNVLLAYSTSSTDKAGDGIPGSGSRFCNAFCRHALDHSLTLDECFRRISQDVLRGSPRQQQPWTYSSLQNNIAFTDLPRFFPRQRHVTQRAGSWSTSDSFKAGIFVGADNESVWHITPASAHKACHIDGLKIVGAAHFAKYLLVASEDGKVFTAGHDRAELVYDTSLPAFGVTGSLGGTRFALFGPENVTIFDVEGNKFSKIQSFETTFEIYCGIFLTNDLLWIGGENGHILSFNLSTGQPKVIPFQPVSQHINAMTVSHDGKQVFCAGQTSLAAALDTSGALIGTFENQRQPKTAAGLRASLSSVTDAEVVDLYKFNRGRLSRYEIEQLENHIGLIDFRSCSHAPGLPILALGTSEGTVLLLDTRDGQCFQEIDVTGGVADSVCGLQFMSDTDLAVFCFDGEAVFYSAKLS